MDKINDVREPAEQGRGEATHHAMLMIAKKAREKQQDGQELDAHDLAALKYADGLTHQQA